MVGQEWQPKQANRKITSRMHHTLTANELPRFHRFAKRAGVPRAIRNPSSAGLRAVWCLRLASFVVPILDVNKPCDCLARRWRSSFAPLVEVIMIVVLVVSLGVVLYFAARWHEIRKENVQLKDQIVLLKKRLTKQRRLI